MASADKHGADRGMIGDLLLTWISETGMGTIADFRARASWLARTEDVELDEGAAGRWLRDAASLGHCEVDWQQGKWSAAPPVITRLPLADGLAILIGARRPRLMRALQASGIYAEHARRPGSAQDIPAPETILIPYDRTLDLEKAATATGATYTGCSAASIGARLSPPILRGPSAPPAYSSYLEHLVRFSPRSWAATSPRNTLFVDGLYREQVHGRWHHLLRREGSWFSVDLSTGILAVLSQRGDSPVRWAPDGKSGGRTGTVAVGRSTPLPPLHARTLVLCSGFIPRYVSTEEINLFDNVPRDLGSLVSSSLGRIQIIN